MSKQYFKKLDTKKLEHLKKIELAKLHEIKLSLIDDAKRVLSDSLQVLADMETTIGQAEQLAARYDDVLGDSNSMFKRIDSLIDAESNAYNRIEETLQELGTSADALGLDASDIREYADLDKTLDEISDRSSKLEDMFQLFDKIVK